MVQPVHIKYNLLVIVSYGKLQLLAGILYLQIPLVDVFEITPVEKRYVGVSLTRTVSSYESKVVACISHSQSKLHN